MFGSYLYQTSGYRAGTFIAASSLQPQHILQISAHLSVPQRRSIFEGIGFIILSTLFFYIYVYISR